MRAQFLLFLLLASPGVSVHADDITFTGYARGLDTGELLYVESHAVRDAGSAREIRVVLYQCLEGSPPFARKQLQYGAERIMPTFDFQDARSGFAEGLTRERGKFTVFERAGSGAPLRTEAITPMGAMVADAGFDEFVIEHWDALERGTTLKVPFLVPSLKRSVNFRVRKVDEAIIDGELASVIRLSLAGAAGWFLPDIDVSYRRNDRRLLRYRGLTTIRDTRGKLLAAQIDFPDAARHAAPVDLAALRALPLVKGCL